MSSIMATLEGRDLYWHALCKHGSVDGSADVGQRDRSWESDRKCTVKTGDDEPSSLQVLYFVAARCTVHLALQVQSVAAYIWLPLKYLHVAFDT